MAEPTVGDFFKRLAEASRPDSEFAADLEEIQASQGKLNERVQGEADAQWKAAIGAALKSRGWKVSDLAMRLRITPEAVTQALSPKRNLKFKTAEKYAAALGLRLKVTLVPATPLATVPALAAGADAGAPEPDDPAHSPRRPQRRPRRP